jgi:hypothetical protein
VGVFQVEGKTLTIVGNHFKSKGGDDALFGVNWPPVRVTEVQRKIQAQVVRDFVRAILDADPDALVMVAGDLNDFPFGEPGEGADHPLAILEGMDGGLPLVNLVNLEKDDERFTYVYDGNSQVLDHMLVSLLVGSLCGRRRPALQRRLSRWAGRGPQYDVKSIGSRRAGGALHVQVAGAPACAVWSRIRPGACLLGKHRTRGRGRMGAGSGRYREAALCETGARARGILRQGRGGVRPWLRHCVGRTMRRGVIREHKENPMVEQYVRRDGRLGETLHGG